MTIDAQKVGSLPQEAAALADVLATWFLGRGVPQLAEPCASLAEHWSGTGRHAHPSDGCLACGLQGVAVAKAPVLQHLASAQKSLRLALASLRAQAPEQA